jgi:hypothetical protein
MAGASEGERRFVGDRQIAALVRSLREEFDFPIHASYLAALPSTRAISQAHVFYVAHLIRSIQAIGASVPQPFSLSAALVRNWSSLLLNRMLNVVSDP